MSDAAAAAAPASPSGKKPVKVSQLIEERQLPPLDYSFKELKAMSGAGARGLSLSVSPRLTEVRRRRHAVPASAGPVCW